MKLKTLRHASWMAAFITLFFCGVCRAQDASVMPAEKKATEQQDMQVILDTMQETLNENRALREELNEKEKQSRETEREANALRGRLRTFERTQQRALDQQKNAEEKLAQEREVMQKDTAAMKAEVDKVRMEMLEIKAANQKLAEENEQVRQLLQDSILAEEKEEYDRLIHEAQNSSDQALQQVSDVTRASEEMKNELSLVHFQLGNIYFDKRDFEMAVNHYNKVLALEPSHAETHHNMGIIFDYYIENNDKAIFHYRNFLQLQPLHEQANAIRERILELRLAKSMVPGSPLNKEFFSRPHYTS
ncbi:MAG: hypothetical protein A2Z83_06855 [Omnitrophica bacterium GWA2_52_8]|nr:MAG: hypothetical protein A2Z83_06855 [Omnitrophica bacterium GWA2_52_8]